MEILEIIGDTSTAIFWSVGNVFALIAIFDGTRRICQKSYTRSSILFVVLGFGYCAGASWLNLYVANMLEDVAAKSLAMQTIEQMPENWGIELGSEEREKKSKYFSGVYFKQTGSTRKYVDSTGKWKPYCPTKDDLSDRKEVVELNCKSKIISAQSRSTVRYWVISSLLAALFGFVASNKRLAKEFGFAR